MREGLLSHCDESSALFSCSGNGSLDDPGGGLIDFLWLNELLQFICITSLKCFPELKWQFFLFGLHRLLVLCFMHLISNAWRSWLSIIYIRQATLTLQGWDGLHGRLGKLGVCFPSNNLMLSSGKYPVDKMLFLSHLSAYFSKYFWQLAFHPVQHTKAEHETKWLKA